MADRQPSSRRSVIEWDRTICPPSWTGIARQLEDEAVFVCGACEFPQVCADKDRCVRELDNKRIALPKRIALCPDCAPEFYYPLVEGERPTCPVCSLDMAVYERTGPK